MSIKKIFHFIFFFILSIFVFLTLFFCVSIFYNQLNSLTVNYSLDFNRIYGTQEKQLLVRDPELLINSNLLTKQVITIGGSTTWGSAMTPILDKKNNILNLNETFPFILNSIINTNNLTYNVSNLGVVGSSSLCTLSILKYFDLSNSKILIVHNGYNDLPIFQVKDNYAYILNTNNKESFCMYKNKFIKSLYDIKRLLSHNFPILSVILNKGLVNGDKDIYLGHELTNKDLFDKIPINEIYQFSLYSEENFLSVSSQIINYAKLNNLKVLFIIEPEIEIEHSPNGSSFRYSNSMNYLKNIHIQQQNKLVSFLDKYNDKDIKYIDVRKNFRNQHNLFYDEIHFNSEGNTLLAQIIFNYLNSLGWIN